MIKVYVNADGRTSLGYDISTIMQPDCLEIPVIREALEDIEEVVKIEGLTMYSKRHGVKSPLDLSNGLKALILCWYQSQRKYDELISNACFGDNVVPYLQKLGLEYDFSLAWDCYIPMDWNAPISMKDMRDSRIYTDVYTFQHTVGLEGGLTNVPAFNCENVYF